MTKDQYREAFSKIQPSKEAVDRLMAIPKEHPKRRASIRLGALIAVAAIVVLLLGGTVYAISHWFQLTDGKQIEDPKQLESGEPSRPAPQNGIRLEDQGEGNYIGFTLDGWSLSDRKNGSNNIMLKAVTSYRQPDSQPVLDAETLAAAYTQYFPITPDDEKLCVQILDRDGLSYRDYFTRYETELVKEGTLNGMDTVWLTIKEAPNDFGSPEDTYHLFCHSEELHCTLVVSSNRGFERCEEALSHLTLVDSGVPLKREALTICGLRLPKLPEGFEIDWEHTELLEGSLPGWERKDPNADLSGAYALLSLVRPADRLWILLSADASHDNYEHVSGYTLNRTGTLNGHMVLWFDKSDGVELFYRFEDGTQVCLYAKGSGAEVEAILEDLALHVEPVPIDLIKGAPLEFFGLAQG